MVRRRKIRAPEVISTQAMENALWLMGLAKRPGIVLRLELDAFPTDFTPRVKA